MTEGASKRRRSTGKTYFSLISGLHLAILNGAHLIDRRKAEVEVILLCNTVHFFLEDLKKHLVKFNPRLMKEIRFNSLIDATVQDVHLRREKKPLVILSTHGSRRAGLYQPKLEPKFKAVYSLCHYEQHVLDRAIEDGVKAACSSKVAELGGSLLLQLSTRFPHGACILMGCTEIFMIISYHMARGGERVKTFLQQCSFLDPVSCALHQSNRNILSLSYGSKK